jgi:hypothetical protein
MRTRAALFIFAAPAPRCVRTYARTHLRMGTTMYQRPPGMRT